MWSWFWITIEATVVFVLTGFALIACGVQQTGFIVVLTSLIVAAVALPSIRSECRRYAIAQVRAIVTDPTPPRGSAQLSMASRTRRNRTAWPREFHRRRWHRTHERRQNVGTRVDWSVYLPLGRTFRSAASQYPYSLCE